MKTLIRLNRNYILQENKGFTLIELLVVVLIIGILTSIALPRYTLAVKKAKMMEALSLTRVAAQAQRRYYLANGKYSNRWDNLDISFPQSDTDVPYSSSSTYTLVVNDNTELIISNQEGEYWVYGIRHDIIHPENRSFIALNIEKPTITRCCFYNNGNEDQKMCASIAGNSTVIANMSGRSCYSIQ